MSLAEFFDLPWPSIASFITTVTVLLFTVGPKVPKMNDWLGSGVQRMVGVTALRSDMQTMHEENQHLMKTEISSLRRQFDAHTRDGHGGHT